MIRSSPQGWIVSLRSVTNASLPCCAHRRWPSGLRFYSCVVFDGANCFPQVLVLNVIALQEVDDMLISMIEKTGVYTKIHYHKPSGVALICPAKKRLLVSNVDVYDGPPHDFAACDVRSLDGTTRVRFAAIHLPAAVRKAGDEALAEVSSSLEAKLLRDHDTVVVAADFNQGLQDEAHRSVIGEAGGWKAAAPAEWTVARSNNTMCCFDGFWWKAQAPCLRTPPVPTFSNGLAHPVPWCSLPGSRCGLVPASGGSCCGAHAQVCRGGLYPAVRRQRRFVSQWQTASLLPAGRRAQRPPLCIRGAAGGAWPRAAACRAA